MPDGDWTVGELGRRLERLEDELESLRFVRIEDYEADKRNEEHDHLALTGRLDVNSKRIDKLDWQVKVVLGGLAAGLLGYAGVTARGLM